MRINFATDGAISVDVTPGDTADVVLNILSAIRTVDNTGSTPLPELAPAPRPQPRPRPKRAGINSLNRTQYEMWEFLVDNDCERGVHRSAAEQHFGLSYSCAGQRLGRLVRAGLAYRVGAGWFRAKAGDDTQTSVA
jgi:hypothetical protein